MRIIAVLLLLMLSAPALASESPHSVYVGSLLAHYDGDERNNEGLIALIGYSYKLEHKGMVYDTGVNIFEDSYSQVSGSLFSNISYGPWSSTYFTPMLMVGVVSKGDSYEDDTRQIYPFVLPKLRIGKDSGVFTMITASPEWVSLELGYSW